MSGRVRPPAVIVVEPPRGVLFRCFPDREAVELPLPQEPFDLGPRALACPIEVDAHAMGEAALLAAVRNVAVVIRLEGSDRHRGAFIDELARVADVEDGAALAQLTDEQRALLRLLAQGRSITEAAEAVGLSRRTAHRRLDAARRALGVKSVTEAILHESRPDPR